MRNFQDFFEIRKRSFFSVFSVCMTVPISLQNGVIELVLMLSSLHISHPVLVFQLLILRMYIIAGFNISCFSRSRLRWILVSPFIRFWRGFLRSGMPTLSLPCQNKICLSETLTETVMQTFYIFFIFL